MAWAGYCDQCRENVWLGADGSCPRGHTADHISGAYEAGPPPQAAPQQQPQPYQPAPYAQPQYPQPGGYPPQYPAPPGQEPQGKKSHTGCVIAAVAVVVGLLFLCGIMAAIAVPIFNAAKSSAGQKACFANQRTVSGASQAYMADKGALPKTLNDLVDAGLIESEPVCPSHGTYTWDEMTGEITCSVHGSYKTGGQEPPTQ
jgi:competence protein ComGC